MDKVEALIIRACKSNSQVYRLKALHKRFYFAEFKPVYMVIILSEIVGKYDLISLGKYLKDYADPSMAWQWGCFADDDHNTRTMKALISIISLTSKHKFTNLPTPRRFKD